MLAHQLCRAGIKWLEEAAGFQTCEVYRNEGVVMHAELRLGEAVLMLGTADGKAKLSPLDVNGGETGSVYAWVPDIDAAYGMPPVFTSQYTFLLSRLNIGKIWSQRERSARRPTYLASFKLCITDPENLA